ncbi:MAG: aminotransferase class V-fold PLP-dependent enzyme [Phycisphaeraceae bacterium]|nr:MAG: aminotransferase class V-fold PLP-dependent enzyme [Phycisphaeraceae bacterium]
MGRATIYLDNNATTRPLPEVAEAVQRSLVEHWHNPSSIHRPGQSVRQQVELARQSLAKLVGVRPREVIFTSGATESIDLAIRGVLAAAPESRRTIVTTRIEHEAVRDLCESLGVSGVTVRHAPLLAGGIVDSDGLEEMLDESVALVSVQWANNETGSIQPVERIGEACRARKIAFHCDGSQWVGKMPTDLGSTPIDLLSLSGHKFHAPKGIGALIVRPGVRIRPVLRGVQEQERRGGTENVPGILGLGAAAESAAAWLEETGERQRLGVLRDRFERLVLDAIPDAVVNGPEDPALRLWNTTNIGFPGLESEALLLLLSERGVCASAGAACSSGSLDPSPVLLAMGVAEPTAHGSLRFSLSRETSENEIEGGAQAVIDCVARLRRSATSLA